MVLKTPTTISQAEIAEFGKHYAMNAGPYSRSTAARSRRRE
jgi:carbonic anhydrase